MSDPVVEDLMLVGWVRWDGDEFFDFRYSRGGDDPEAPPQGYLCVWAKREDAVGG